MSGKKRRGRSAGGDTWALVRDETGVLRLRCRFCGATVSLGDWFAHRCPPAPEAPANEVHR